MRYVLRPDLRLDGDRLVDPPLQRAIRLGEHDRALVVALQQPRTFAEIQTRCGVAAQARLTALARLYLLAGRRSDARLALQQERTHFLAMQTEVAERPLLWPEGRRPPQHGCVGTGTCCAASFLGPVHEADARRVNALAFGRTRPFVPGDQPFETKIFQGKPVRGMARRADGACVAQGDDGLCEIHLAHGPLAKPVTCQQFPLRFHASPDGVHVSLLLACDGYHQARPAGQPWPERAFEVRSLLQSGAVAVRVTLPATLSAGLPIAWSDWQSLRARCFAAEPAENQPRQWLDRVLALAESAILARQAVLTEGPDVTVWSTMGPLRAGLQDPYGLWPLTVCQNAVAELRGQAASLPDGMRARDRQRLLQLADGLMHLTPTLPLTDDARQHLTDIVANDLAVHVVLGELDAGLANLVRRLLIAHGVAQALAQQAGKPQIDGQDTTQALHVVYRSEPELTWLGQLQSVANPRPVP